MKILITGADGYIGFPLLMELCETTEADVIAIDNDGRNIMVEKCGGKTQYRSDYYYGSNYIRIEGNLANRNFVNEILAIHRPDTIIHLASQPSMPYSQINGERAIFTQQNNLLMMLNILWGVKENGLLHTRIITTTTTGIPGQFYKRVPEAPTINDAGSWYHVSRGFDSANCRLASKQWEQEIVEFRTSIVYGLQTNTMREYPMDLTTRFDTDSYFGTVLNRFINQALEGEPITIYGRGLQTKPFIALQDVVTSLKNALTYGFRDKYTILNQVTECVSIKKLAQFVQDATSCKVTHIENPRKEKETHKMTFENSAFLKVLCRPPITIKEEIREMVECLKRKQDTVSTYCEAGKIIYEDPQGNQETIN